jgi:hypothetical protein
VNLNILEIPGKIKKKQKTTQMCIVLKGELFSPGFIFNWPPYQLNWNLWNGTGHQNFLSPPGDSNVQPCLSTTDLKE